jgi:acetyl-CoA C-acetyltransferase
LLTSYEAARAAGVPDDRVVFLHATSEAHDHWFVTERASLTESPGMRLSFRAVLDAAGIGVDDVARFDLYSCFPSAVQLAMKALGLRGRDAGDKRALTVTGGLGFAGGPVNNYPTHGIAKMVEALRTEPETIGMTTALGWYATKHAAAVWSGRPPRRAFRRVPPAPTQADIDALPSRSAAGLVEGTARVEATSVAVERDGVPSVGIVTALLPDGDRVIANTRDTDLLAAIMSEPWEGREVCITNDGATNAVEV